jgi:phage tail-like protein
MPSVGAIGDPVGKPGATLTIARSDPVMSASERKDPYRGYRFVIEIDGAARAGFTESSGLVADGDAVDYREGSDGPVTPKPGGPRKYPIISLKRGITGDAGLWQWYNRALAGQVERKNGSVIRRDDTGAEAMRWNFHAAWPAKWEGPGFNASGNDVAIENLELAHEGLELANTC